MPDKLMIELMTPEKMIIKEGADSIVVPGYYGELGIYPGHMHYISLLLHGKIRIMKPGSIKYVLISGGVMEVRKNTVQIMVSAAEIWLDQPTQASGN